MDVLCLLKTNNEIFGSLSLLPQGWSPEAFIKGWKTTGTYTYAQYFINTFALVVPTTPAYPGVLLHRGLRFCQV